jgi:hypothetical protein
MKKWIGLALGALALGGCAVEGKGILLSVEPATPLDQRDLHKHCDLGDQAACALSESDNAHRPTSTFAVVQGLATPDRAVFTAILPKDSNISWFIYDRDIGRLWKLHDSRKQQRPGSAWYAQRVEARELEPGRTYELLAGDKDGKLVEDRTFRTLSIDGKALRFAAVSGMAKGGSGGLVTTVREKKPQFVLFAGDNVEATLPKKNAPSKRPAALDWYFERHLKARQELALARERELTPIIAIWGESELGQPGADNKFVFRDQAREVFEMFFPVWADETSIVNGPGLSKSFSLAGQKLALLDPFSFRTSSFALPTCLPSPKKGRKAKQDSCREQSATSPGKTRFGTMQANWVFRQASQGGQPSWLISSDSWLGIFRVPESATLVAPESWISQLEAPGAQPSLTSPSGLAMVESAQAGRSLRVRIGSLSDTGQELSSRQVESP